jgi:hypothetical protein
MLLQMTAFFFFFSVLAVILFNGWILFHRVYLPFFFSVQVFSPPGIGV